MRDTIRRFLEGMPGVMARRSLSPTLDAIGNTASSQMLSSAALTTNTAVAKTGISDTYGIIDKTLVKIAASTNMPALVGTVTNATFGGWAFYSDASGNLTSSLLTQGATLGAVGFPSTPLKQALIGFVIINPTGAGNFIGGTTSLTDGTVVPNAVFCNCNAVPEPTLRVY